MEPIGRSAAKVQPDAPARRAVVLVGHGGVPRDYPRDRLMQLFQYAWPFAGEHLTAFFVEHLRQFDNR